MSPKEVDLLANTLRRSGESRLVADESQRTIGGLLVEISGPIDLPWVERFVASEEFTFGKGDKGDKGDTVRLSLASERFANVFFDLVEEDVEPAALSLRKLLECSAERPILAVLGGRNRARIALAHMHMFLKRVNKTGVFLCYVADKRGVIWSVDAIYNFSLKDWDIDAVQEKSTAMLDVHRVLSPAEL